MKTAALVRQLLEAGATAEVVEICLNAIDAAVEEAIDETKPRKRVRTRRKPELKLA